MKRANFEKNGCQIPVAIEFKVCLAIPVTTAFKCSQIIFRKFLVFIAQEDFKRSLLIKDMNPLDATRTPHIVQSTPWKERTLFWVDLIGVEKTLLKSVPQLQ